MQSILSILSSHKFFLKNLLFYSLIIMVGIGLTAFFTITTVIEHLLSVEARYEREILGKVADNTEEKIKSVDRIFSKLRFRDYFGLSIADLLNPEKNRAIAEADRSRIITANIQNLCYIYPFITDFIILDYHAEKPFFYSNDINRDIRLPAGFFHGQFISDLRANPLSMGIIADHVPDFIQSYFGAPGRHVISVFGNLTKDGESDDKLATVIITIDPAIIRDSFREVAGFLKGKIMVTDGNGLIIFDSAGEASYTLFDHPNLLGRDAPVTIRENDRVISVIHSAPSNFNFINIIRKDEVAHVLDNIAGPVADIAALCIVISFITTVFVSRLFMRRINRLTRAMRLVENGDFSRPVTISAEDEIGYIEKNFNNMCRKLEEFIRSMYISTLKMKTSELKALQAQINPHFMFNTLESIRLTALTNNDRKTAKMVHILGNLFRWNIRTREMIIGVSDEIEYLTSYVELQKIRYADSFGLTISINPDIRRLGIPKLLLQPLVENAIHHGIGGRPGGETILIEGRRDGNTLRIAVEDHGAGIPPDKLAELKHAMMLETDAGDDDMYNIGLRNVHQRIRLLFGEPFGLELTSTVEEITMATVAIPALAPEEMKQYVQGIHR